MFFFRSWRFSVLFLFFCCYCFLVACNLMYVCISCIFSFLVAYCEASTITSKGIQQGQTLSLAIAFCCRLLSRLRLLFSLVAVPDLFIFPLNSNRRSRYHRTPQPLGSLCNRYPASRYDGMAATTNNVQSNRSDTFGSKMACRDCVEHRAIVGVACCEVISTFGVCSCTQRRE